jgi:hypothetical protein
MLYIDEETQRAGQREQREGGWWTTPYGAWRLAAEIEAMRRFPQFEMWVERETLGWSGLLVSALEPSNRYRIRLIYPGNYPDHPPEVAIVEPEIRPAPHLLDGRRPCLFRPGGHGYEPARTTAATMIAWTALWIHAYETWRQTGEWPGSED